MPGVPGVRPPPALRFKPCMTEIYLHIDDARMDDLCLVVGFVSPGRGVAAAGEGDPARSPALLARGWLQPAHTGGQHFEHN